MDMFFLQLSEVSLIKLQIEKMIGIYLNSQISENFIFLTVLKALMFLNRSNLILNPVTCLLMRSWYSLDVISLKLGSLTSHNAGVWHLNVFTHTNTC